MGLAARGGGLVLWVLESASVAADQWYGHAAAPASPVASGSVAPVFAALAVIGLIPVALLLHGLRAVRSGPSDPTVPAAPGRNWPAWALAGIAVLVGGAAILGGVRLIRDGFGLPPGWLGRTPFTSWTLPGVLLLAGVAAPQLVTAVMIVIRRRAALMVGYLAGLALLAWIGVQLLVLQRYFFLQPVIAALGLAEVGLAWGWQRSGRQEPGRQDFRP